MTQELLFPELRRSSGPEVPPPPAPQIAEEPPGPTSGQLLLFTPLTIHRTELESAVAEGDFVEAVRLRDSLSAEYGPVAVPDGLACLDVFAACTRDLFDLTGLLAVFRAALLNIADSERRKQMTRGLLARLVARVEPGEIARCDGSWLPDLANFLYGSGRTGDARGLIRDALLNNVEVLPDSIEEPRARDLLAETLALRWLACLGALRGVWPAPSPDEPELAAITAAWAKPLPGLDADRALAFWECLRVAALKQRLPESLLHATRRRMKALHPEFHQLHMGRSLE